MSSDAKAAIDAAAAARRRRESLADAMCALVSAGVQLKLLDAPDSVLEPLRQAVKWVQGEQNGTK